MKYRELSKRGREIIDAVAENDYLDDLVRDCLEQAKDEDEFMNRVRESLQKTLDWGQDLLGLVEELKAESQGAS
ncbi:MAG: hypothetical protein HYV08_12495 [Deltaproteobacteria bacterium]|nr:hypothetical protein [Deltaproteobacteria bacterium]MBI3076359.1 hypothetical protein [Deltaproteobacteria bacterium]